MIKVLPLDFTKGPNGVVPRDPHLWDAAQRWAEEKFGEQVDVTLYARVWVVLEFIAPETYRVRGMTSIWNCVDVPMLHLDEADTREERQLLRDCRDALVGRLRNYCEDRGLKSKRVLVCCSEQVERRWRGFLRLIGAKKAGRYEVTI